MGRVVRFTRGRMRNAPWVPLTLVAVGVAGALAVGNPSEVFIGRDCVDFRTQADAQRFFEAQGATDRHKLDGDHDGRACEALP